MSSHLWEGLKSRAQLIVELTLDELPPEVRAEAVQVPCLFLPECEDDPSLLGRYGHFEAGEISPANGPILLYLRTIADYCDDEDLDFDDEVRLTFLHELGHHFGWDEGDLEERGLA